MGGAAPEDSDLEDDDERRSHVRIDITTGAEALGEDLYREYRRYPKGIRRTLFLRSVLMAGWAVVVAQRNGVTAHVEPPPPARRIVAPARARSQNSSGRRAPAPAGGVATPTAAVPRSDRNMVAPKPPPSETASVPVPSLPAEVTPRSEGEGESQPVRVGVGSILRNVVGGRGE